MQYNQIISAFLKLIVLWFAEWSEEEIRALWELDRWEMFSLTEKDDFDLVGVDTGIEVNWI